MPVGAAGGAGPAPYDPWMTDLPSSTTLASMIDRTSDAFVAGCEFVHEPRHQRVGAAMYRILAGGRPASITDIASRAEVTTAEVEEWVGSWPAVFRDDDGAVTGFFGLSVDDGFNHRADVDGMGTAWTWCTYDPLFIARVLGATVRVSSHCPVTGTEVRVTVTSDGVEAVEPATAVMSMMPPDLASFDDIITTLCHFIWFFADDEAARSWTAENPDTFVVSIEDGFEIGRRMTDAVFDVVLAERP